MRKRELPRPSLFIGSSKESLDYAYAIQQNLEHDAEVTVWTQGIFELTKSSVESLMKILDKSDFAIFVFAPNDTIRLRQNNYKVARDNVVFELGLFMGKLGRERTFIVIPRGSENFHIPTDLAGITPGRFDPKRKDKNLQAAFGPFCHTVRGQIHRKGKRIRLQGGAIAKTRTKSKVVVLSDSYVVQGPQIAHGEMPANVLHEPKKAGLTIDTARYGAHDKWFDVANQLRSRIQDNKLFLRVNNDELGGDPISGWPKILEVTYSHGGQKYSKSAPEGGWLSIP